MHLVEVIKEGEIVRMPEWQAREEDLFILRKVAAEGTVVDLTPPPAVRNEKPKSSRLEEWKARSTFAYKRNNVIKDLVSNFHWEVSKARKSRNMTRKQLADSIGASEDEVKMIELGELPRDDFVLINKIENRLEISLRKSKPAESANLAELQKKYEAGNIFGKKAEEKKDVPRSASSGSNISGTDIEIIG